MGNENKAKGTAWETEVVKYLAAAGLDAKRTGSADAGSSDIHAGPWTLEAKAEVRIDLPGYLRQLAASVEHAGRDQVKSAVWVKNRRHSTHDAYVVMRGENFRALVDYVETLEKVSRASIGPELTKKLVNG